MGPWVDSRQKRRSGGAGRCLAGRGSQMNLLLRGGGRTHSVATCHSSWSRGFRKYSGQATAA